MMNAKRVVRVAAVAAMAIAFASECEAADKCCANKAVSREAACGAKAAAAKIAKTCKIKGEDKFYGFDRVVFDFMGRDAWVVFPSREPAEGRPWTWCMQWATAYVPRTNVPKLLANGYHHVTIDTFRHRMNAEGLRVSAAFQKFLVDELGLAPKANLIGMSWGGFFSTRYALAYPQNVAKIYLDAPLLTFTEGRVGGGSVGPWSVEKPADGDWLKHPEMPVNNAKRLAMTGIPVLLLYGGQDQTVPAATSAELFAKRFRTAGGDLRAVERPMFGHHPHGVEESDATIMNFFNEKTKPAAACFPGEASGKTGWKLVGQEAGKVVYIPFEGYYESKGGRIESPRFPLDKKVGENAYYRLTFSAKSEADGYWWVDLFDKDGNLLPDVNSRLYASKDWLDSEVMVPASPAAASASIAFISRKGAYVKDVTMRRVSVGEVFEWCNGQYAKLPQLNFKAGAESWTKLPKTKKALTSGGKLNVVLLGDSIMNDSYCGMFTAMVQREFPKCDIRFHISVRGSTGCWYYHEEKHFEDYVAKYRPDFVVIGGISNYLGKDSHTLKQAEDWMVETINRCKAIGAEVLVCTPAPSWEFRSSAAAVPFDAKMCEPEETEKYRYLYTGYEYRAAERTGVQIWDATTAPCDAISRSGKPLDWFKRDGAHSDDRGKQLIARTLLEHFRAAKK